MRHEKLQAHLSELGATVSTPVSNPSKKGPSRVCRGVLLGAGHCKLDAFLSSCKKWVASGLISLTTEGYLHEGQIFFEQDALFARHQTLVMKHDETIFMSFPAIAGHSVPMCASTHFVFFNF